MRMAALWAYPTCELSCALSLHPSTQGVCLCHAWRLCKQQSHATCHVTRAGPKGRTDWAMHPADLWECQQQIAITQQSIVCTSCRAQRLSMWSMHRPRRNEPTSEVREMHRDMVELKALVTATISSRHQPSVGPAIVDPPSFARAEPPAANGGPCALLQSVPGMRHALLAVCCVQQGAIASSLHPLCAAGCTVANLAR